MRQAAGCPADGNVKYHCVYMQKSMTRICVQCLRMQSLTANGQIDTMTVGQTQLKREV